MTICRLCLMSERLVGSIVVPFDVNGSVREVVLAFLAASWWGFLVVKCVWSLSEELARLFDLFSVPADHAFLAGDGISDIAEWENDFLD